MLGLWIVLGVVALAALWAVLAFNRLVTYRNRAEEGWSQIDVQLRRRYDLIPNLVETVEGYAAHEREVFEEVARARSAAMGATGAAEQASAENAITSGLRKLLAVAENYPQLKASDNFRELQSELGDLENKIAAARRFLNNAVAEYNARIEQFPGVLVAGMLGFAHAEMYALDAGERVAASEPPKVSFGG